MMMDVRPLHTEADYDWALKEVEGYFENEPAPDTLEGQRLEVLITLIKAFEQKHFAVSAPAPLEVIKFYMEQNNLTQSDLACVLNSRSRASEFLSGKCNLSQSMIIAIRNAWGITADLLLPIKEAA